MDLITFYIKPEAFILIPVLYFIGLILDQTPFIPKWSHAWIKLAFAILACLLHFGLDITSAVQGILVVGAEMVLRDIIHNTITGIYKNTKDKNNDKES